MKKRITIGILVVLLIVIFFFIYSFVRNYNIEKEINNTLKAIKNNDYKITLSLEDSYKLDNINLNTKIEYNEIKDDNKNKYEYNLYENNTLRNKEKIIVNNSEDGIKYYKDNDGSLEEVSFNSLEEAKYFNLDFDKFLNKIKNVKKSGNKYKKELAVKDVYGFIYNNTFDIKGNTILYVTKENNKIKELSFEVKLDNETYNVNITFDYNDQTISME